jgi:hypothetical protein
MFFATYILCAIHLNTLAQKNWEEIVSVEQVCENYPEVVKRMLNQFDLDRQGLEKVKAANDSGNTVEASKYLLDYYKKNHNAQDLRKVTPPITTKTDADADTILNNVFVIQNVRGQVLSGADGHRDWYYKGPNNDREWAWLSNRHSQLAKVFSTYLETGNPRYAKYIDLFLRDFIIKSMPYPEAKGSESIWRGLEVAARAKVWSRIFYGLINCEYLSPSTQLFMLASLPDHAHYNRNFHGGNNWLTMEISALATIAAYFPEYKASKEWMAYSIDTMTASMKDQVYPDGVQTELTSHYHNVALSNFELFKGICEQAGQPLPDYYNHTLEKMYSYIAHVVRPSGYRLLNNDGDRGSDRNYILQGAKKFDRPEWEFIASNGKSGTKPSDGPSYFYRWAGHFVSRSGFDAEAHWSFFDIGPWGSGHQHNDKLHISVSAYGRDLLVDAGRFAYTGAVAEKFRSYARSTAGHNTLLIDHKGQEAGPTHAQEPLGKSAFKISDRIDYSSSSIERFIDIEGEAKHFRSIIYVRGEFWVVVDRIITDRPRTVDALWHWHPDNNVVQDRLVVKTNNAHGNLAVIPIGKEKFELELVSGQEQPEIQGWYSPEYNIFGPNTASVYRTEISASTNFVWLLLPSENQLPKVKAKVLDEDEQGVKIAVKSKGKTWAIAIPFMDSEGVTLTEN